MIAEFVKIAYSAHRIRSATEAIEEHRGELERRFGLQVRLLEALELPMHEGLEEMCFLACSSSNLSYCIVWAEGEIIASYGTDNGLPSISTPLGQRIRIFTDGPLCPPVVEAFRRRFEMPRLYAVTLPLAPSSSEARASSA